MLATSLFLITTQSLFPILLGWFLAACTIAALGLYNHDRIRRHDNS